MKNIDVSKGEFGKKLWPSKNGYEQKPGLTKNAFVRKRD